MHLQHCTKMLKDYLMKAIDEGYKSTPVTRDFNIGLLIFAIYGGQLQAESVLKTRRPHAFTMNYAKLFSYLA